MASQPNKDSRGRFVTGNKAALKSGISLFLSKGILPKVRGIKRLKGEMQRIKTELEASISPLGVKEEILINQICKSHLCCALFEEYCKRLGLFDAKLAKKGVLDFQGGFSTYLSLLNAQRHALRELSNIQSQNNKKPIMTIQEILKEDEKNGENTDSQTA